MHKEKEYTCAVPSTEVLEAVKEVASGGGLNCPQAWALAKKLGVPVPVIGRAADMLGLKIRNCSLGCFK